MKTEIRQMKNDVLENEKNLLNIAKKNLEHISCLSYNFVKLKKEFLSLQKDYLIYSDRILSLFENDENYKEKILNLINEKESEIYSKIKNISAKFDDTFLDCLDEFKKRIPDLTEIRNQINKNIENIEHIQKNQIALEERIKKLEKSN